MRSLFLYGLKDAAVAAAWLNQHLPPIGDGEWALGDGGRIWAWLRLGEPELYGDESDADIEWGPCIIADLSSTLPDRRDDLIAFLGKAQAALGGVIRDDNDVLIQA